MLLSGLQQQAFDILANAAALQMPGLTVYRVDNADSAALYAEALASAGTAVGILPPLAEFKENSSEGPVSDGGVTLLVNVSEPVEAARAQGLPPVTDIAEAVAWLLHSQNVPGRADDIPLGVRSIRLIPDKELLVYQITCVASGSLQPPTADTVNLLTVEPLNR